MDESTRALIDEFCDAIWLEDGLSQLTLDAYRRDLGQLATWLANAGNNLAGATEADMLGYLASRHAGGAKATSSNRRLSAARRFYRWLVRQGKRAADPTASLDSAKQATRFPKTLSETDVERLLAAPDVSTTLGLRDRAMLEVLYASGLRVTELVSLRVHEVSLSDNVLRVASGPNDVRRGGGRLDRTLCPGCPSGIDRRKERRCAIPHCPWRRDDAP